MLISQFYPILVMMLPIIIPVVVVAFLFWWFYRPKKHKTGAVPADVNGLLEKHVKYYRQLSVEEKSRFAAEVISRRVLYYVAFGVIFGLLYQGPRQLLGYFGLQNSAAGLEQSLMIQLGVSFLWGYAFIHYYLDSKIWRVRRDPNVGKALHIN